MVSESQSLHSSSSQVVDPTFDILSVPETRVYIRHASKVPNHGNRKEKRTQNLYEALIVSVFLLFLFLTGCSGSMIASSQSGGTPASLIQLTGEANLPPHRELETPTPAVDGGTGELNNVDGPLKAFIRQEAVIERVRIVAGWLKFVGQMKSADLVEKGWARLNGGQQLGALKTDSVHERPDISIRELILWRQILVTSATPLAQEEAARVEALAISLTSAMTPDDVARLDNLLVVPERVAGY